MKNLKMFCISLEPNHYDFTKELGYIPVGLGEKHFSNDWFSDKSGISISRKNKYYGEYTFHYWLWKNYIDKLDDKWIGFCQYRKFWTLNNYDNTMLNIRDKKYNIDHIDYIGFNEISLYLDKEISIEDTMEKIHIRTRQYAKRQMKWFDNQSFHNIFDMDNIGVNDIVDKLVEMN